MDGKLSVAEVAANIREDHEGEEGSDIELVRMVVKSQPEILRGINQEDYIQQATAFDNQKMFSEMSGGERLLTGVGKGMQDIFQGAKQLLPFTDDVNPEYEEESRIYEETTEGDPYALAGEIAGATVATLPIGGAVGGLGKLAAKAPALTKLATMAPKAAKVAKVAIPGLTEGFAAAGIDFTEEDESRMQNALYGSLFGAGGAMGVKLIGKVGKKAYNSMKGKFKDARFEEMVALANQHDVPVTYGDISGSPIAKKAEVIMEEIPLIGTGGVRSKGAVKSTKAMRVAEKELRELSPGEDVGREIQKSLGGKLKKVKDTSRKLYDEVERLSGDRQITPKSALRSAKKILGEIDESDVPSSVKGKFNKIQESLSGSDKTFRNLRRTRSDLKGMARKYATAGDSQGEKYANELRSAVEKDINNIISEKIEVGTFASGKAPKSKVKPTEVFSTGTDVAVKGTDVYTHGKGVAKMRGKDVVTTDVNKPIFELEPDPIEATFKDVKLEKALKKADKFYREKVVPFKTDKTIKAALKSNKPDQIFKSFIRKEQKDLAQNFYNALDDEGRSAVRYGMIKDAIGDAKVTNGRSKDALSPGRFAKALEDLEDARGVFFEGKQAKELEGLTKLMRAAERFGHYGENPPTGQRLIQLTLAGGAGATAVKSPLSLIGALSSTLVLNKLLTTKVGRNFLLASSKLQPDSPKMTKLIQGIERHIEGATARATAKGKEKK